ncbi:MAG: hypothetical protein AUK44_01205, partial [Porphyromonadaceae bacterium CG2_30_38_12]
FRKLISIGFVPIVCSVFMFLVFVFERGMGWNFSFLGIHPRHIDSLWTISTAIFIHANWSHLFNNLISFFLLSSCVFYFYRPIELKIFLLLWLVSGFLLWVIGRESSHIGASGFIYALASFLFFSGLLRRHVPLIAISLVTTMLYGNMIWHVFPWTVNDPVSWEGHLSGFFTGVVIAIAFRKQGPQKPIKVWEDNSEDLEISEIEEQELYLLRKATPTPRVVYIYYCTITFIYRLIESWWLAAPHA